MLEYIKSDLFRYWGRVNLKGFIRVYMKSAGFRYTVALRMLNGNAIERIIGSFLWIFRDKHIVISRKTKIGYGFYIGHGGPLVVNPSASIGNNVNLSQFVTIGSNDGQAAEIGDNVYIGPNSCIVEHVKIGNNVTIGAGSVVTKDIPDNATAAGNYAKSLNYNEPGRYILNKWRSSCENTAFDDRGE